MTRPLRLEFPRAVYHVTSRGNARQKIVRTDIYRQTFLSALAHVVDRFRWRCHAYCLMGNHHHLLIGTPRSELKSRDATAKRELHTALQLASSAVGPFAARALQESGG